MAQITNIIGKRDFLQWFVSLPPDDLYSIPQGAYDQLAEKAEEIAQEVEALKNPPRLSEDAVKSASRNPHPLEKHVLKSMLDVAKHITGRDVEILIQEPVNADARGECWYEDGVYKMAFAPFLVGYPAGWFSSFTHELAHIRLNHLGPAAKLENRGRLELEARMLQTRYLEYTKACMGGYAVGNVTEPAYYEVFQRLYCLLDGNYAANMTLADC